MAKNVLVILADQLRKDYLGCYGNPIVKTPAIDRLSKQGVRLDRNYVANPICMPNRHSIFTGRYVRNHGIWTNGLLVENEHRMMPHEFSDNGYQTASFGKIHFTPYGGNQRTPESTAAWGAAEESFEWNGPYWGFQRVELAIGHTEPLAHYGRWFKRKGGQAEMLALHPVRGAKNSGVRFLPPELHDSTFVADRTVAFLREERDPTRPFFAVASFPDPHPPYNPPKEIADRYSFDDVVMPVGTRKDLETRPAHYMQHFRGGWKRSGSIPESRPDGFSIEHQQEFIAHTYAMVDLIDSSIGRILNTLDLEELVENTIVVFTSDHGGLMGEHGLWGKGPFFFEGLINTPMLVSAPGILPSGVFDHLFSDVDLAPTLYDLCNIPSPEYVDGISHAEQLLNRSGTRREHCLIEYRNGYGAADCSSKVLVTNEGLKYVRYQTGEQELTDLAKDPEEAYNLARSDASREIVNRMSGRLLDEIMSTESKLPRQVSPA